MAKRLPKGTNVQESDWEGVHSATTGNRRLGRAMHSYKFGKHVAREGQRIKNDAKAIIYPEAQAIFDCYPDCTDIYFGVARDSNQQHMLGIPEEDATYRGVVAANPDYVVIWISNRHVGRHVRQEHSHLVIYCNGLSDLSQAQRDGIEDIRRLA